MVVGGYRRAFRISSLRAIPEALQRNARFGSDWFAC